MEEKEHYNQSLAYVHRSTQIGTSDTELHGNDSIVQLDGIVGLGFRKEEAVFVLMTLPTLPSLPQQFFLIVLAVKDVEGLRKFDCRKIADNLATEIGWPMVKQQNRCTEDFGR